MASLTGDPRSYDLSAFSKSMTGKCLCGKITVIIDQPGLFDKPNGHLCHCANCRKSSGSSAINLLLLPSKNVTVVDPEGALKYYFDTNNNQSGNTVPRCFCSNCGSSVGSFHKPEAGAKVASVALGLFPRMPEPEFELFTAHRQPWLKPAAAEDKQFEYREEVIPIIMKMLAEDGA